MKGARASGAGKIIVATAAVSVLWIAALWALLMHSEPCLLHVNSSFAAKWLSCRPSNEIGDFLAGAFAPLAFIWLAVAVIIQSLELRAQREEFALSREVAEETQQAIKAQADEARKQAEFIGAQTKLLEAAEQGRRDERKAREFEALIGKLAGVFRSNPKAGAALGPRRGGGRGQGTIDILRVNQHSSVADPRDFVWRMTNSILNGVEHLQLPGVQRDGPYSMVNRGQFDNVQSCLEELISVIDELPIESRTLAQQLRLEPAHTAMNRFQEMLEGRAGGG